jgi:probable HAF family extracellular repeat protein
MAHPPGVQYMSVEDLNDGGWTTGWLDDLGSYRWSPQTHYHVLGEIGSCTEGGESQGKAINNLGHVVGVGAGEGCNTEAFFWSPETGMIGLGDFPGVIFNSYAIGINDSDQVAGTGMTDQGSEAFIWHPTTGMVGLGDLPGGQYISVATAINNSGWVTGWSGSSRGGEGFLWTPEAGMIGIGDLSGGPFANSEPYDINNLGQIVGIAGFEAFVWDAESGMRGLGWLDTGFPYATSWAFAINDRGEVVGASRCCQPNSPSYGFIWDTRNGMRRIDDLLDPCAEYPYNRIPGGMRINNNGEILSGPVILKPYLPGDLDEDMDVQLDDLSALLSRFGTAQGAVYADGDLDCDGDVSLQDLTILLSNFGESYP